jgi:hypothetical protein
MKESLKHIIQEEIGQQARQNAMRVAAVYNQPN